MISIIFLLLIGIIALGYLLYQQQKSTRHLKEKLEELTEIQEIKEIKSYLEGRDQERDRIAKDWHDGIGNSLSTLRLIVDTIQPKNQERHTEALSLLEHTQREFRQIVENELVNNFSDTVAILSVLEKWQQQLELGNIELVFKVYNLIRYNYCSAIFKNHLYRILQELLTNAIKYSKASCIQIIFQEEKDLFKVGISDNGIGLKKEVDSKRILRSIRSRLKILAGIISIETEVGGGMKVEIFIPLDD